MWLFEYFFLNSANLICRGTYISKYLIESLGIRDNGSRLYHDFVVCYIRLQSGKGKDMKLVWFIFLIFIMCLTHLLCKQTLKNQRHRLAYVFLLTHRKTAEFYCDTKWLKLFILYTFCFNNSLSWKETLGRKVSSYSSDHQSLPFRQSHNRIRVHTSCLRHNHSLVHTSCLPLRPNHNHIRVHTYPHHNHSRVHTSCRFPSHSHSPAHTFPFRTSRHSTHQ